MDLSLFALGPTGWGDELLAGLAVTLTLAVSAFVIGTMLGGLAGVGELYSPLPVRWILGGVAMVLRSVPELLLVFLVYYGAAFTLSGLLGLFDLSVDILVRPLVAGIAALAIVQAAYTSEVTKGALLAVPRGAVEAAAALGLRPAAAFLTVRLPLALHFAFPGLANLWMVVIKNTPFVSAIGVADLVSEAATAGQNTKHYFAFFFAVLLAYLVISALSMAGQLRMERRLFRHVPPPA